MHAGSPELPACWLARASCMLPHACASRASMVDLLHAPNAGPPVEMSRGLRQSRHPSEGRRPSPASRCRSLVSTSQRRRRRRQLTVGSRGTRQTHLKTHVRFGWPGKLTDMGGPCRWVRPLEALAALPRGFREDASTSEDDRAVHGPEGLPLLVRGCAASRGGHYKPDIQGWAALLNPHDARPRLPPSPLSPPTCRVNKAAYASAIGLLVLWVIFRFVGPNLGLYRLAGDLMSPMS
jgi:hypothetical protein